MNYFVWAGIVLCLMNSAVFSGMTLGLFGLSRLRLEIEAEKKNQNAEKVLKLRKDGNFLLATLLWGNVGINVLLTLLTDSVLTGVGAFLFSTIAITILGEIVPQAYFSRHALKAAPFLVPLIKFYQLLLFIVAKPTSMLLDLWLGKEGIGYFQESDFKILFKKHVHSHESNIDIVEGTGATNFLMLDDIAVKLEGEVIHPESIIEMDERSDGVPVFPKFDRNEQDGFLQRIHASTEKWVVLVNKENQPKLVLDADGFLRHVMYDQTTVNPYHYCHLPIVIKNTKAKLGDVLGDLKVVAEHIEDDVIDHDIILYWAGDEKRIITGADILGRLMRGIAKKHS